MKKILIVGKKSFIGSHLYDYLKNFFYVKIISFKDLNTKNINYFDYIINCSIHPNYVRYKYNKNYFRFFGIPVCFQLIPAFIIRLHLPTYLKTYFTLTQVFDHRRFSVKKVKRHLLPLSLNNSLICLEVFSYFAIFDFAIIYHY